MVRRGGAPWIHPYVSLLLLVTTSNAQLLDADECGIGYQYRSPPNAFACRENATVSRLDCHVALPPLPPDMRADVLWYRRSLSDAELGSNAAVLVNNRPPFKYIRTLCNREPPNCPPLINNLTVHINRLMIENFSVALQGDYLCQVLVINESNGAIQEELELSNCARLELDPSAQTLECVSGDLRPWRCADQELQSQSCPQQVLRPPIEIAPSSSGTPTQQSLSSIMHNPTTIIATTTPTTFRSTIAFSRGTYTQLQSSGPPSTGSGQPNSENASYIYAVLGAIVFLLAVGIGTAVLLIVGLWCMKQRRSTSFKVERNEGGVNSGGSGSKTNLNRVSTLYSKPFWPNDLQQDGDIVKEHHYATIPAEQSGVATDTEIYSYAYQHHLDSTVELVPRKQFDETGRGKGVYQGLGIVDYIQMYSKPSPLLVGGGQSKPQPSLQGEEKGYKELSTATLNPDSI